ncbi:two-component system, chemotaxis family, response regulator CheB [Peptoclostridium litorale DSM 5388]|uniref:Protein-glutamate methylesterase/protein-glutamine glutaminase n=1 Tax=Peptoclostridium litorale DSM 5388 TaxID=1121324 RepID=A0A069RDP1_PEPLI|nr:chemotaxis response regulator protein-glutamate methylesterase [Peptoclostridium litorale]KDR95184.1 chemotaxis response regulator protein-glutamate methylesterase CheB [Peptoclostridium litorale DSM 5388]SIN73679.1 two-component system, chemotaxis family, response regulator CheB [Peptoclostridium litorale DSM 5388]
MKKVRALIVDDSAFIRKIVSDILSTDPEIEIVDKARNGKEAIEKLLNNDIDVITLDVEMPIMDGITTLSEIMKIKPTPVVMLSGLTKQGADLTIQALEMGAVDFITKPSNIFKIDQDKIKTDIVEKVKVAAGVDVKRKRPSSRKAEVRSSLAVSEIRKTATRTRVGKVENIVAIGTSTGGPKALQNVIPNIEEDINASIVVVQHMPAGFTKSLAERINNISRVKVKEAEHGDVLENGVAYIAPGDRHIKFEKDGMNIKIVLDDGPNVSGHKPSVDAMFYSLTGIKCKKIIPVIMTGMGHDGAKGMDILKQSKSLKVFSIAEDEESCVVFGMPKSAINLGAVDKVLHVNQIANEINKLVGV